MKALLELVDDRFDLDRVLAICARHKVRILDRSTLRPVTTSPWPTPSNLWEKFGKYHRVKPDDPRGRPFSLLSVHLADPTFPLPREEIVASIENCGGRVVDSSDHADVVVWSGPDPEARFGRGSEHDSPLVIGMSTFRRALPTPKPKPLPPAGVVPRKIAGDVAKVWKLLASRDAMSIAHGLELLSSLGDSDSFDALLTLTDVDERGDLVRGGRFEGSAPAQGFLDVALLGVLSAAPAESRGAALRGRVRSLEARISCPPLLRGFDGLETLNLNLASPFSADGLAGFGHLPALKSLVLKHTDWTEREVCLRSFDGLDAPQLERLEAEHIGIHQIEALRRSPRLVDVDLSWNDKLTSIEALGASHRTLRYLNLERAESLASIEILRECDALEWVTLEGCASVKSLAALKSRRFGKPPKGINISRFSLAKMDALTDLYGFPTLPVETADLSAWGIPLLSTLRGLCGSFTSLDLQGCTSLCSLAGLEAPFLKRITIETTVHDLGPLKNRQGLIVELNIGRDGALSPACLAALGAIESLVVSSRSSRIELKGLSALANLRSLDLSGVYGLEDIAFVCELPKLESLWLRKGSPESRLAGGATFKGASSLIKLRQALADHYGFRVEKESPDTKLF